METHVSEAILTEILARLPLRSIWRFKSVCKAWKSAIESVYFRRLFVSVHKNRSSCWSLVVGFGSELIKLHRCKTWDLPESLGRYVEKSKSGRTAYAGCSNGLVVMYRFDDDACYVGNPVLQQWVKIPAPPYQFLSNSFGLVTRVDEDGVVLGFKVVRMVWHKAHRDSSSNCLCLCVYSSETGVWTRKRLDCPRYFPSHSRAMGLNGTLYMYSSGFDEPDPYVPAAIVAHDFYGESSLCKVIPLPDHDLNHNRALTASAGFVMYIKTLPPNLLKIWMLLNDSEWQLVWDIRLPFDDECTPLAMNPFDRNLVYLWNRHNRNLVSCNLHTQNYNTEHCLVNQSTCEELMDGLFKAYSRRGRGIRFNVSPFVFPRWIESMPRPPQLEMMDTTSLLASLA